jgi:protease secretion system membrane fusion protein
MSKLSSSSLAETKFNAPTTDQATPDAATTAGRAARVGLWALGLGFGGFVLWASLAPLDEGVPAQGMVSIDTKRKSVQHLSGGLVKEVLVKDGDHVKEGQLLVRLDEAVARSNFQSARQRYLGLRAMEGRLLSEQRGQAKITFHADVLEAAQDPQIQQLISTQEQLFSSRQAALRADMQATEESVQGQQGLIQAYETMLTNRKSQQALLAEELTNTRALVKEGYAPRNRQLELERMGAEVSSGVAELQGNMVRAKRADCRDAAARHFAQARVPQRGGVAAGRRGARGAREM